MRAHVLALAILLWMGPGYVTIARDTMGQNRVTTTGNVRHESGTMSRSQANQSSAPGPICSRQTAFVIPFVIDRNEANALEVLLYVSTDCGVNWTLHARQPATQGQFLFQAPRDAEYWFASRTIAQGVAADNSASIQPELKVVVDTAEPRLDVQATVGSQGEINVTWEAIDEQLAPDTLKVECQSGLGGEWRPVSITKPGIATGGLNRDVGRKTTRGATSWRPDDKDRIVSVRVEVRDQADNVSHLVRRVIIPLTFGSRSTQQQPIASSNIPADPFAMYGLTADDATKPETAPREQTEPGAKSRPKPKAVSWPSDDFCSDTSQSQRAYPPSKSPVGPTVAKRATADPFDTTDTPPARTERDRRWSKRAQGTVGLPPGERPRMTRSKRFNLDYSIDAVGPLGVQKVEMWVTRNGGRDWDLWGLDEDRESPFLVDVEDEGIYGFRIVIVGKNGLASESPRSGDLADLWVGVDTTKPVAEITAATYGSEAYAGHLDIRWNVMDDHLGLRPITLQFSERRNGDWTTIASGLPNTGQYHWRVDSRVPDSFYLRLEVRDEAGNVNSYQLDRPIQSAGLTPKGQVRAFRSL